MPDQIDGPRLAPSGGGPAKSLVVLLHGYGADGNDLIGIGGEWAKDLPHTAFVAPNAPEPCGMNPAGRQWFDLTMRDPSEYSRGVNAAGPGLNRFLDDELDRYNLTASSLALVGFSQGTMMALHLGLQRPDKVAALVGFSGMLADPEVASSPNAQRPPIILVHGDQDEVIPIGALFVAAQGLGKAEIPVEWHISAGIGHGIAPDGLEIGRTFLRRALPPSV